MNFMHNLLLVLNLSDLQDWNNTAVITAISIRFLHYLIIFSVMAIFQVLLYQTLKHFFRR